MKQNKELLDIDLIANQLCEFYRIPKDEVFTESRKQIYVDIRHKFYYFAKRYTNIANETLGKYYGHEFSRTTVICAINRVNKFMEVYEDYNEEMEALDKLLRSHLIEEIEVVYDIVSDEKDKERIKELLEILDFNMGNDSNISNPKDELLILISKEILK